MICFGVFNKIMYIYYRKNMLNEWKFVEDFVFWWKVYIKIIGLLYIRLYYIFGIF